MFTCNLHCQLFLRISGNMLHKKHVPMQNFPLYLKKAGLASQNIVHLQKNILRCVGFCLYILLKTALGQWLTSKIRMISMGFKLFSGQFLVLTDLNRSKR